MGSHKLKRAEFARIARDLADGLRESLCSDHPRLFSQLLRLLANGKPVSLERLAVSLKIPITEVATSLRQMASVEFDPQGNIIGSGLTLTTTPHSFLVKNQLLFTWCAFDTLFFPVVLQQPAQVISVCPANQSEIRLRVGPEGIEAIEPDSAVVSIVIPDTSEARCSVRGAFCNDVHFFSSPEAATTWLTEHNEGIVLSVNEAFELGQVLSELLFGKNTLI